MNRITLGSFEVNAKIRKAVNDVLDSGRLSYGKVSREYEERFAMHHNSAYGVVSNSGTSSLLVALQALKETNLWPDGAEVIVPAITFVATVNVVLHNRLRPVFVDVNPVTFCLDEELLEAAISKDTVAIMPVHMFGHPARMDYIMDIAEHYGLFVVEDCCEAMCAEYSGRPVGSYGDIGCFSTYVAHHLVTGVGGMATTSNKRLSRHMRSLVNHGIALDELPTGEDYDPTFLSRKFLFDKIGHSFRITELEAAIGLAQMDDIEKHVAQRTLNAKRLTDNLMGYDLPMHTPVAIGPVKHSWMMYPIILDMRVERADVMRSLNKMGVETRTMMPLINQPCYANLAIDPKRYPVASFINDKGFYVGCHHDLINSDMEYLSDCIMCSIAEVVN